MSILQVKNLKMYYNVKKGWIKAVNDISFNLEYGDNLGLVGESGCGKTSLGFSIINILSQNAKIMDGQIIYNGVDLSKLSEKEMNKIRWNKISMVFQSAMNALNPVLKIKDQLLEALMIHKDISKIEAEEKIKEVFELVGLPSSRLNHYPHEFSGGMKQRVIIAMSVICGPELIIADEPTTGLDVVVQDQILQVLTDRQKVNATIIWVSHNIAVIAETCNKIAVMYGGKIFEYGEITSTFDRPYHPYTYSLLRSIPTIQGPIKKIMPIDGSPPNMLNLPEGCSFAPRCSYAKEICKEKDPPLYYVEKDHYSLCHFAMELDLDLSASNSGD